MLLLVLILFHCDLHNRELENPEVLELAGLNHVVDLPVAPERVDCRFAILCVQVQERRRRFSDLVDRFAVPVGLLKSRVILCRIFLRTLHLFLVNLELQLQKSLLLLAQATDLNALILDRRILVLHQVF